MLCTTYFGVQGSRSRLPRVEAYLYATTSSDQLINYLHLCISYQTTSVCNSSAWYESSMNDIEVVLLPEVYGTYATFV